MTFAVVRIAENRERIIGTIWADGESEAQQVAAILRDLGHDVWLDDAIPAHRAYVDVIEERLREARAVVVIWSAEAVKSQWVRAEADAAVGGAFLALLWPRLKNRRNQLTAVLAAALALTLVPVAPAGDSARISCVQTDSSWMMWEKASGSGLRSRSVSEGSRSQSWREVVATSVAQSSVFFS